jgi:hypothetical protein
MMRIMLMLLTNKRGRGAAVPPQPGGKPIVKRDTPHVSATEPFRQSKVGWRQSPGLSAASSPARWENYGARPSQ